MNSSMMYNYTWYTHCVSMSIIDSIGYSLDQIPLLHITTKKEVTIKFSQWLGKRFRSWNKVSNFKLLKVVKWIMIIGSISTAISLLWIFILKN